MHEKSVRWRDGSKGRGLGEAVDHEGFAVEIVKVDCGEGEQRIDGGTEVPVDGGDLGAKSHCCGFRCWSCEIVDVSREGMWMFTVVKCC
jgi:hypothetical protein